MRGGDTAHLGERQGMGVVDREEKQRDAGKGGRETIADHREPHRTLVAVGPVVSSCLKRTKQPRYSCLRGGRRREEPRERAVASSWTSDE